MAKFIDRTGEVFGSLTVLECVQRAHKDPSGKIRPTKWLCACACGNKTVAGSTHLVGGMSKSCGKGPCNSRASHGLGRHPLYRVWFKMRERCYSATCDDYPRYGGRGITIHEPWINDVAAFVTWVETELGPKPTPQHTIDRVDNDGGYFPGNLRWGSKQQQSANRRCNTVVHVDGVAMVVAEACRLLNMCAGTVRKRLKAGWSEHDALYTPTRKQKEQQEV